MHTNQKKAVPLTWELSPWKLGKGICTYKCQAKLAINNNDIPQTAGTTNKNHRCRNMKQKNKYRKNSANQAAFLVGGGVNVSDQRVFIEHCFGVKKRNHEINASIREMHPAWSYRAVRKKSTLWKHNPCAKTTAESYLGSKCFDVFWQPVTFTAKSGSQCRNHLAA